MQELKKKTEKEKMCALRYKKKLGPWLKISK